MRSPEAKDTMRRIRLLLALAPGLWALTAATPLDAQLGGQYTTPGRPSNPRPIPTKEEFKSKLDSSPWKAGSIRLSPWLGLQNATFIDNLNNLGQDEGNDFTLTVGAGLRGYLPAGRKVLFAAHALPEYVWWQDDEDKRRLNGRFGLGLFVFFNRATLELSQRRLERQGFFSSEIQALTTTRSDLSTFSMDVELARNLSLFALVTRQEANNQEDETTIFDALDRTEESGKVGLRFENEEGWSLEVSHEDLSSEFATDARNLSSSGTTQRAILGFDGSRMGFHLTLANNDFEGDVGSEFGTFTEATGAVDVLWNVHQRFRLLGYARRDLRYSVNESYSHVVAQRQGATFGLDFEYAYLNLFAETGEDDFVITSLDSLQRLDDVTAYGADLQISLKKFDLSVRTLRTEYDSNLDSFDRNVTSVNFGIRLEALASLSSKLLEKLSIGRGNTDW